MKKIMFNDRYGLTKAVLSGRKTMTRRIVPPIEIDWNRRGRVTLPVSGFKHGLLWMDCSEFLPGSGPFDYVAPQKYQPRYSKGDVVAVAQRYANDDVLTFNAYDGEGQPRKDGHKRHQEMLASEGYRNKMFVRAEYMPHRIRITDLWFERLQDISDEDAMREGIRQSVVEYDDKKIVQWTYFGEKITTWFDSPRAAFAALIDRISGRGTWKSNPWVVAYEFELINKED